MEDLILLFILLMMIKVIIIIDCSYTKFFLEMDTTGTPRYLMNICSWLAAIEKHNIKKDCNDAINFKPKSIDLEIFWDSKFTKFMERKNKLKDMKTLFVVDDSGSVFNQEIYFNKVFQLLNTNFYPERGDAFYIWNEDKKKLNLNELKDFFEEMDGEKGTNSSLIADIAEEEKDNNFEHLIIITDGDVKSEEIDKSDKKFKEYNLHFSFVSCFIIDTGDVKMNLLDVLIQEIVLVLLILLTKMEIKRNWLLCLMKIFKFLII